MLCLKLEIVSIITAFVSTLTSSSVAHSAFVTVNSDKSSSQFGSHVANTDTQVTAPPTNAHIIPNRDISKSLSERQEGVEYLEQAANNMMDYIFIEAYPGGIGILDATCNTDPLNTCIWNGINAVFDVFFDGYLESEEKRDANIFITDYPSKPGCGTRCRLHTEAEEGEYRAIGNITNIVNGTFHTIHYMRNGTSQGLRSVYEGRITAESDGDNSLKIRQDGSNQGGFITDYYWDSGNEAAYDLFDSYTEQIQGAASDVESCLLNNDALICCASFGDDQLANNGFVAVGWNNQAYFFNSDTGIGEVLANCQYYEDNQ